MNKKYYKKFLAWILTIVLLAMEFDISALAADTETKELNEKIVESEKEKEIVSVEQQKKEGDINIGIEKEQQEEEKESFEENEENQEKIENHTEEKKIEEDNKIINEVLYDDEEQENFNINVSEGMAKASELISGDYTYTLSGDEAVIIKYTGNGTKIVIPDTLSGHKVVSIGSSAFEKCKSLTEVTMPSSILSIGHYVFSECKSLEKVELSSKLEEMGSAIFEGTGISSITIPKTVTTMQTYVAYNGPLAGANELKTVIFEEGIRNIPDYAISSSNGSNVEKVVIPETVIKIGKYSFYNCDKLTGDKSIKLPSKLEEIGNYAFSECNELVGITFNDSLIKINNSAFANSGIQQVKLPIKLAVLGASAFAGCKELETVIFTENSSKGYSLTIGGSAFANAGSLTKITMSSNITSIGSSAFEKCKSLTEVAIPSSVLSIGHYVFSECKSLEKVELSSKLEEMGSAIFEGTGISSITIPKTVTTMQTYVAYNGPLAGANELKTVIFEEGIRNIPDYAISSSNGSNVEKVVIPETVIKIGKYSFYNCKEFTIYGYKNSYAETYAKENEIPFLSVAISKQITPEDVLKHLNINNLINDINLNGGMVNGPIVTVGGKTFSLFSMDTGIELKLSDSIQAKVDPEEKTIQVMIGFNEFEGSATLDKETNSTNYWSESYKQVKDLYLKANAFIGKENVSTKNLYNDFRRLRKGLRKYNMSMGINASASIAGYIEFNYSSGEIVFSEGGLVMEAELGTSMSFPLPPCPAVYATFGMSLDCNGKLKLVREGEMSYTPSLNTELTTTATIGVGAGSKKAKTYAELGLKGSIKLGIDIPKKSLQDAFRAELSAKVYFDSKILGFNGPNYEHEFPSYQLYPRQPKAKALFGGRDLAKVNYNKATLTDRNYLLANKVSAYGARKKIGYALQANGVLYTKDNLYYYNTPKLICLNDGTMLLIWIDDNGTKSGVNKTSLMYSVYNGTTWSKEKAIAETGGANDYPTVFSDGKKVQIVWQKAEKQTDSATLTTLMENIELYSITYENGTFSEPSRITSGNKNYEMLQSVTMDQNHLAVVWMENSKNDPFQGSGSNKIKAATYENGTWKEQTVVGNLAEVNNLIAGYISGKLNIVYETSEKETGSIHILEDGKETMITGINAELEKGILYYIEENKLMSYDLIIKKKDILLEKALSDFDVIDNGKEKVILSTIYNGFTSELAAYQFDYKTGQWVDNVILTDSEKYIRDYSATLDKNGKLITAFNFVEVEEKSDNIFGAASLSVIDFSEMEDLIISSEVVYEDSFVVPQQKLPISFEVTNNGMKDVKKVYVTLRDENGTELSSGTVTCNIASGKTSTIQYWYQLPKKISCQKITAMIYAEKETRLSNNEAVFWIGDADLSIEKLYISGESENAFLKGQIKNLGYCKAENVVGKVYDQNREGTLIGTVELKTIKEQSVADFQVSIPQEYFDVNPLASGRTLYIEITTSSDEVDCSNNNDYYMIQSSTDMPLVLSQNEIEMKVSEKATISLTYSDLVDISTETVEWKSENEKVVTVNNGTLTAVGSGETTVIASIRGYEVKCKVTVIKDIKPESIYLNETSIRLTIKDTKQLTATILPENVENQKIVWKSSDNSIATVSEKGIVTAVSAGTAVITATIKDDYKEASCAVTVEREADTTYTISFQGGEGSSGKRPASIKEISGKVITLPENTFKKEGYDFIGWGDGEINYQAGDNYRVPYQDIEFIAQWEKKEENKGKGDVDSSGKVDVNDALIVLKIAASLITPTEEQRKAADVSGDGEVDSGDALLILKYAAGLITEL